MSEPTKLQKLEKIDRRWVFLVMLVAVSIPLFVSVDLPLKVTPAAQSFYDSIEALQPGDIVYYAADYDPGSKPELDPMLMATLDHLCRKDVKIVSACLWPAAPPLLEAGLNTVAVEKYGKEYGVDFVHLGFKEGKENVMVQLGKSFRDVFPQDYYGTKVEDIPLLAQKKANGEWMVDKFDDVKMIVNISAGYPGTKEWVQQVRSRYNIPIISGCTAVSAPEYYTYLRSDQLSGLLGGLSGAAEYEDLVNLPGFGIQGMAAQSLGHVAIILMILVGNILYFINSRK
ncbi:MAG: hypothetical protein HKN21_15830 [Candidatus Eisenbacteria bacterium]|uniref:Uncharacterized protein n=1 Tax=Eiseniibacteriota bacterium TaxID=2212470 RepID=A0A7Y2EGY5_UNCEI|nr:hypothetical protein [Candidatus Eisenbacteria bacterium]